jgi:hypothetical protein
MKKGRKPSELSESKSLADSDHWEPELLCPSSGGLFLMYLTLCREIF